MRRDSNVEHSRHRRTFNMGTTWQEFSKEISQAVDDAGRSIVAVDGRSGHTSSGVIWRAGFVLTAAHSIRHETNIAVIPATGTSVQARLVGKDRGTDIALLKLDQQIEAPPAQFGSTTSLSIGELVIAVARTRRGNIVASSGIISGLMGEWQVARTRIDQFIRPDLNLYPGFSGGALIGAGHGVLGLNTTGLLRGKPITIPSSTLARIAEEMETKGHVAQPYIGIVMQPVQLPESLQKRAEVSAAAGLLVMHVEAGSPADVAGVILGDVLIDMDGRSFDDLEDVHMTLREKGGGKDVHAGVIRAGQRAEITIRIGERPLR
jgi:S1-C subfamily serine protease